MCSMFEDDLLGEECSPIKRQCSWTCRKCSSSKVVILLQKKNSYCRSCFIESLTHKFRATVGKLKLKQTEDCILLIFFGNLTSTALLHLLKQWINQSNHKKIRLYLKVLYIDESILWPKYVDKSSAISKVLAFLKGYDLPRFVMKLSAVYECVTIDEFHDDYLSKISLTDANDDRITSLFSGMENSSSKTELLSLLRYHIFYQVAVALKCNKMFIPECATNLAIGLMCDTILGRSSHIPYNTTVRDGRNAAVDIIRPLKEITIKELAFFNIFHELELLQVPSSFSAINDCANLQLETSLFIHGLHETYPSTVHTVCRIGDKLSKNENHNSVWCSLCKFPITQDTSKRNDITYPIFNLCYSCQFIINDIESMDVFPTNLLRMKY